MTRAKDLRFEASVSLTGAAAKTIILQALRPVQENAEGGKMKGEGGRRRAEGTGGRMKADRWLC